MGKRVRIIFILVFVSLFSFIRAQDVYQTVSYFDDEIKAGSFNESDYGHKILNSIAITNVKGLKWLYVGFKGRILIQTEQSDDGHIFAYSKLIDYQLSGDKNFRAFDIDTLLIPKAISGKLSFMDNGDTIHTVPIEMLLTGAVIDLGSVGIPLDSLSKLRARIDIDSYIYTEDQYNSFLRTSRLINYYYSYSEVLKLLVDEYTRTGINRKQSSAHVFTAYHEISRVSKYVKTYEFESKLHLRSSDPLGFLKTYAKLLRLEKRAGTIFFQVLQTQVKGSINEKELYCRKYAGISEKYSNLATSCQPYIAAGFIEVMRIFQDSLDKPKILNAEAFYDVFNKLDLASTPQCIYDEFISKASLAYENEKYVEALDYLYNATFIDKQFDQVFNSVVQQEVYIKTLDKLMSAYLHIAIIAYRSGNFIMADNYYRKADEIYVNHIVNLSSETISLAMFLNFVEQQVELAYGFLSDNKYYEGLKMVDRANSIASNSNLDHDDILMDSAYSIAYFGIYQHKLDSIGLLIESQKPVNALGAMEETTLFIDDKEDYLTGNDSRIKAFAASLFDFYFAEGKRLLKSREPENALFSFLEAQSINEKYMKKEQPDLDSLIYFSTVPVIVDLTEKGEFEVWANRIDEASVYYDEAVSLQLKYKQEDNDEINVAIARLKERIANQSCVNLGNETFGLRQKVMNRLKRQKYPEAELFLTEAQSIIDENPECEIEKDWIDEVENKYSEVFLFYDLKAAIEILLEGARFKESVSSYLELIEFSKENNLTGFGIDTPDLIDFVKENNSKGLIIEAADHYTKSGQPGLALDCLDLARKRNVPAKETRGIQESVALSLAERDSGQAVDKKIKVIDYTNGDKWYKYFRSTYLSN